MPSGMQSKKGKPWTRMPILCSCSVSFCVPPPLRLYSPVLLVLRARFVVVLWGPKKKKGYIVRRLRITVRQLQTTNNGKGQKKNLCSGRHMELLKHQLSACLFYRQHAGRQKSRSIDSLCPDTVPCIALYLVTIDQAFFVSGCGKGPLGPAPPSVDPLRRGSDGWANRGVSNRMVEAQSIFLTLRFVPSSHYCHIETCMRKHSR